ncbi:hypothetical protein [Kordia sp.]|uniref:hypothetical protein n=1 Tax=Kordia sp. TaxID=1965332 RepID=UPI0025C3D367|nr:hypothetical protein [Kordia sp.]MCH2192571.1 hypothetical protein [Kordia sp.]
MDALAYCYSLQGIVDNKKKEYDKGLTVLQQADLAFSQQYKDYFRWDLKFGIKINSKKKKLSHQFYVDLQNITNQENVFERRYNRLTNNVDQVNQIGLFPDVGYRLQF